MTKSNNKKIIFLNTVFVISETIINKFAFFIINIIVSRYLKEVKFGEYATALGFATYFAMFSDIGINTTLVRMIIKDP
ncbi:MAG TPA: oligosaccharide flippase family protein, partial [Spirochaetota bacterium]|nr:oligosaccharide flippase family protein [Spirochaetota bacterium]